MLLQDVGRDVRLILVPLSITCYTISIRFWIILVLKTQFIGDKPQYYEYFYIKLHNTIAAHIENRHQSFFFTREQNETSPIGSRQNLSEAKPAKQFRRHLAFV